MVNGDGSHRNGSVWPLINHLTIQATSQPISQRQNSIQTEKSKRPVSIAPLQFYYYTIVKLLDAAGSRTSDNALSLETQESSLCQRLPLPSSSLSPAPPNPFTPPCGSAVISSLPPFTQIRIRGKRRWEWRGGG